MLNIKKYIKEVFDEFRKIIFPTKNDVYSTSIYVIILVCIISICIAFVDYIIEFLIKLIIFGFDK